jgi:hypothetical protein
MLTGTRSYTGLSLRRTARDYTEGPAPAYLHEVGQMMQYFVSRRAVPEWPLAVVSLAVNYWARRTIKIKWDEHLCLSWTRPGRIGWPPTRSAAVLWIRWSKQWWGRVSTRSRLALRCGARSA